MPRRLPTRATARANHGSSPTGSPEVDPQDRIDSLLAHLGTKAQGLTGREAQRRLDQLQSVFHTAALGPRELIVLACFPVIVWGSDELWRWRARRLSAAPERHPELAPAGASS